MTHPSHVWGRNPQGPYYVDQNDHTFTQVGVQEKTGVYVSTRTGTHTCPNGCNHVHTYRPLKSEGERGEGGVGRYLGEEDVTYSHPRSGGVLFPFPSSGETLPTSLPELKVGVRPRRTF